MKHRISRKQFDLIVFAAVIVILTSLAIFLWPLISFLSIEHTLLMSFHMNHGKDKVEIIYAPGNATLSADIRVIRTDSDNNELSIGFFEKFNKLKRIRFISEESFEITIGGNNSYEPGKYDSTIVLNIHKEMKF